MNKIYPTLREVCREMGVQFAVADMSFGLDPRKRFKLQSWETNLNEIQRCHDESLGNNLISSLNIMVLSYCYVDS
jgi:hypothetical protein